MKSGSCIDRLHPVCDGFSQGGKPCTCTCHGSGSVAARDSRGRFVSLADAGLAYTLMQDAWAIQQPMSFDAALEHIRGAA